MRNPFSYRFGLPSPFYDNEVGFFTAFSPSALFAANEPGVWFDPSDLTTLFQDPAGTTPVTAPGNTVGLMLDKSRGGVGTNGASRRNLLTFSEQFDNAYWLKIAMLAFGSGSVVNATTAPDGSNTADLIVPNTTSTAHGVYKNTGLTVAGATYTMSVYAKAAGYTWLSLSNTQDGGIYVNLSTGEVGGVSAGFTNPTVTPLANDWYRCSVTYTAASSIRGIGFYPASGDGGVVFAGDGTSGIYIWGAQLELASTVSTYQEITSDWPSTMAGNHATQATLAARPTYSIEPVGGRRNLLTWSEDFRNTTEAGEVRPWVRGATSSVSANTTTAPDGTLTADTYSQTGGSPYITQAVTLSAAGAVTVSIRLKKSVGDHIQLFVGDTATLANGFNCWVNLAAPTPSVGTTGTFGTGATFISASVSDLGNDWREVKLSGQAGTNTNISLGLFVATADNSGTRLIPGSVFLWGAQLEQSSTATAYQRVTTQHDVTEAGVASMSYLYFDGTDDAMVTSTITPGIDKAQVFAGVRKLSDALQGVVLELSASGAANSGIISVFAPIVAGQPNYDFGSKGTIFVGSTGTGFAAPITNVLTGLGDISGDTSTLRVNGTQVAQNTSNQGTGNYLAYPLYIGARGGTTLEFWGHLYSLITRFGPTLDAPTITSTETWVAGKTGIVI